MEYFIEDKYMLLKKNQKLKEGTKLSMSKNIGSIPKRANIRFHLHPEINLIKVRNGSILLKHKKGFIWKMIADNNNIETQESIMFFPSGPQKCQQIIINLNLENIRSNKIESCNWAFELQN